MPILTITLVPLSEKLEQLSIPRNPKKKGGEVGVYLCGNTEEEAGRIFKGGSLL